MRQLWNRLNYRIRNRVYWHVLPVFLAAILFLGVFSWITFMSHAHRSARALQEAELSGCLDRLASLAASEAMSLQTRKTELVGGDGCSRCRQGAGSCPLARADLPAPGLVAGYTFVEGDGPRAGEALATQLYPAGLRQGPQAQAAVAGWLARNRAGLADAGSVVGGMTAGDAGEVVAVEGYRWHEVMLFAPFLVPAADSSGGRMRAMPLLPVLIRERGAAATAPAGRMHWEDAATTGVREHCHSIFYLDLQALLTRTAPAQWWCALDRRGTLLAGSDRELVAGLPLADGTGRPQGAGGPPLSASDLRPGGSLDPADGSAGGLRAGDWLVSEGPAGRLPFTFLAGRPDAERQAFIRRYTLTGLAAVVAALVLAVWGLTRVVASVTRRLAGLGLGMRMVAGGDLSRRVPADESDEVGSLCTYFNDMAGNLQAMDAQSKRDAQSLQEALLNMRTLDRAKQDFLVLISHEVRTPLTAIMGGVDYLKSALGKLDGPQEDLARGLNLPQVVGIIENNGLRLRGFMNDALLLINFQSASRRIALQATPMRNLVAGALNALSAKIQDKRITVANELPDAERWQVLGDPELLAVALGKILDNAVTHNVAGGMVTIREAAGVPEVGSVTELCCGNALPQEATGAYGPLLPQDIEWRLLEIFNTGEAIPAEKQQILFRKFERVEPIRNHQKGTGLSLPLAQTAVERHGGRIYVHSQQERGNSFYLMLPSARQSGAAGRSLPGGEAGQQPWQGDGDVPGDEDVGQMGDPAWFQVEFGYAGAGAARDLGEPGGGVDHPGRAHHEHEVAGGDRLR